MDEKAYIIATNLAKIRIAEKILRDVYPGDEHGFPEEKHQTMIEDLYQMTEKLNSMLEELRGNV